MFHFYCLDYSKSCFSKTTKNSKSKIVCSNCKNYHVSGISTNKQNVTLQSLAESDNFMSIKFDDFNNTVKKCLYEMKALREENMRVRLILIKAYRKK